MAALRPGFKAEAARIAAEVRGELNLAPHDRLDPAALAEHLAIPVVSVHELTDASPRAVRHVVEVEPGEFSAATVFRGTARVIVLNTSHAATRLASSLAHELAHVLLEHEPEAGIAGGRPAWSPEIEAEADSLAGEVLVPREAALAASRAGVPLAYLAARFAVSLDLARWRADATGASRQAGLERWRRRVSTTSRGRLPTTKIGPALAATLARIDSDAWLDVLQTWERCAGAGMRSDELADRVADVIVYAVPREDRARSHADAEPVTVLRPRRERGHAIPPPATPEPVRLDPALVRARLEETAAVHALLAPIFAEEPVAPNGHAPSGLDAMHAELLRHLSTRPEWTRPEVDTLAGRIGLLAGGALDAINDVAVEVCGEPVLDGGDPVRVEVDMVGRLL